MDKQEIENIRKSPAIQIFRKLLDELDNKDSEITMLTKALEEACEKHYKMYSYPKVKTTTFEHAICDKKLFDYFIQKAKKDLQR